MEGSPRKRSVHKTGVQVKRAVGSDQLVRLKRGVYVGLRTRDGLPILTLAAIPRGEKDPEHFSVREFHMDDSALRALISKNPRFLGAIVWLAGHPERWNLRS
jgi:hypothetical protein